MKKLNKNLFILIFAAAFSGCSLLQTTDEEKTQDPAFFGSATSIQNPDVVPVEIALDIKEVLRGGRPRTTAVDKIRTATPRNVSPAVQVETIATEQQQVIPRTVAQLSTAVAVPAKKTAVTAVATQRRPAGSNKYKVKNGDTLMKISFEKFGNVYRWREIYNTNKNLIPDYNNLEAGTVLTVEGVDYVVVLKNGTPYLIRRNDTLVKISNSLYGTPTGWKGLWANNSQLIHDPNKIYAGFTMYYLPIDELPKQAPKLSSYSNKQQLDKLKYIQSLRKPAANK